MRARSLSNDNYARAGTTPALATRSARPHRGRAKRVRIGVPPSTHPDPPPPPSRPSLAPKQPRRQRQTTANNANHTRRPRCCRARRRTRSRSATRARSSCSASRVPTAWRTGRSPPRAARARSQWAVPRTVVPSVVRASRVIRGVVSRQRERGARSGVSPRRRGEFGPASRSDRGASRWIAP